MKKLILLVFFSFSCLTIFGKDPNQVFYKDGYFGFGEFAASPNVSYCKGSDFAFHNHGPDQNAIDRFLKQVRTPDMQREIRLKCRGLDRSVLVSHYACNATGEGYQQTHQLLQEMADTTGKPVLGMYTPSGHVAYGDYGVIDVPTYERLQTIRRVQGEDVYQSIKLKFAKPWAVGGQFMIVQPSPEKWTKLGLGWRADSACSGTPGIPRRVACKAGGAAVGAGLDILIQALANGGDFSAIDYDEVGIDAAVGWVAGPAVFVYDGGKLFAMYMRRKQERHYHNMIGRAVQKCDGSQDYKTMVDSLDSAIPLALISRNDPATMMELQRMREQLRAHREQYERPRNFLPLHESDISP